MGSFTLGKAASLELLLEACIHAFDDEGELHENQLPRTLLLMHRWYVSSTELAGKLLIIYPVARTRLKICYLMRYWIAEFPAEFDLDLGLIRLTEEFRDAAAQLGGDEHIKLLDISTIPSYDWMRKLTQRKKQVKKGKASLLFDHLEPIELAEHLTFLEYKSIRRISFTDYQSYVIHGCLVDNPTLERSIALFNGISQWVQLMVLSKLTPQHRAEVINKYIHVAQKLLHLQNFNTLMAVVGGLSHSSISRLKETHSHLSPEVTKIWNEMTELVSSKCNYCAYRKAFSESEGFKIPILGVHLKDLIAVHVVFPDWVEDGKVNIVKMQQLYLTFNELVSLQSAVAQVEPNMDLIYLLTLSLDLYYTEDEIYELSLLREPRNPKSQPTSPTTPNKPLAPLDWASGVTTKPDPSVVNKHIRKVVDSVFRNYDHDHDGYISQEDFESIAANFPFLDSFCVLDKDQDGLISKDEMMAYFLRANPLLQCKMGPGFIHNFQEMTYLKPTFCEHYCGVNCHKQCRELLVLACRRLPRSTSLGNVSPGALTHSSLPSNDDEVFTFPAVSSSSGSDLEGKSITLMTGSAQRISVRLQRATTSQATQTEPLWPENGWVAVADSGSHTFPKMRYRPHRKASKSKGFARWENDTNRATISTATVKDGRQATH
uniref:Ras guanyl-releasing protein 3-like n=1 Tax=Sinocyclocheilus rhinocerous TaxID=307959 RepID=A0A673KV97_9TELE